MVIACASYLPSFVECDMIFPNTQQFAGTSIDFRIEQPNYKTATEDGTFFNGKFDCIAYTAASIVSDVQRFSVNVENSKFTIQAPKLNDDSSNPASVVCVSNNIDIPASFGITQARYGSVNDDGEAPLRIRAEYKRGNTSRQFADSFTGGGVYAIIPPPRNHGEDGNGVLIPYSSLAKSVSIESSGTIFDAKTGFKLVLKELQHDVKALALQYIPTPRFSSLAPYNTYYEPRFGPNYVNCTVELTGRTTATFEGALVFDANSRSGSLSFKTRDAENYGQWVDVDVSTTGADVAVSCPDLTVLNPSKFPAITRIEGRAHKEGKPYQKNDPVLIFISSTSGLASLVIFSTITIAIAALSMF